MVIGTLIYILHGLVISNEMVLPNTEVVELRPRGDKAVQIIGV
jgi:hypothetical protein